jgi:hypothetical protein
MPPKRGKDKATSDSDSDHEESVATHENRPRIALRYRKAPLSKNKNVDPISVPVGTREMPQDPIYSRLLSSPSTTDKEPPLKKQRVMAQSGSAGPANGKG